MVSSCSDCSRRTLWSMALTEHMEPGWAWRLRVVFSAGSSWREENFRDTCKGGNLSVWGPEKVWVTGTGHKITYKANVFIFYCIMSQKDLFLYLVTEAELNGEVLAISHSLSAGHHSVNYHLGKWCQVCNLTEWYRQLSFVDWGRNTERQGNVTQSKTFFLLISYHILS